MTKDNTADHTVWGLSLFFKASVEVFIFIDRDDSYKRKIYSDVLDSNDPSYVDMDLRIKEIYPQLLHRDSKWGRLAVKVVH